MRRLLAVSVAALIAWMAAPTVAQGPGASIPAFEFDPGWPKPLPNNWVLGPIGGIHVDARDAIWIAHRGNTTPIDKGTISAPAVVVFDTAGGVTKAWGGPDPLRPGKTADGYDWPREHGIFVDGGGNVWLGCEGGAFDRVTGPENCGSVTKMTADGRVLWQRGRTGETKGNADTDNFNSPTGIVVDDAAGEAFISDGYRNQRIAVVDAKTGAFKRMWGPYGQAPQDIPRNKLNGGTRGTREPEGYKTFGDAVHCIEMSRDGLLYVCDRGNNRIHVYRKDGTFVKEGSVAPTTGRMGSVFDIAFSPDAPQQFLYVADGANSRVHIVRRADLQVLGSFGKEGRNAGEFGLLHVIASDSRGHLYIAETGAGARLFRFTYTGMTRQGQ
jgi:DNA-binding beta-propeller fold protein YncE